MYMLSINSTGIHEHAFQTFFSLFSTVSMVYRYVFVMLIKQNKFREFALYSTHWSINAMYKLRYMLKYLLTCYF